MMIDNLRPTQREILSYTGGRMAISAVPGSGKTFTLTRLAAQLIASGKIDIQHGEQVLIVTYLNASVENFKARIRDHLLAQELNPNLGYDVRTLHSLGLEIVRRSNGAERGNDLIVLDGGQSRRFLDTAINLWIDAHPAEWRAFLPDTSPTVMARWRSVVEKTAEAYIRHAKNNRYGPEAVHYRLSPLLPDPEDESPEYDAQHLFLYLLNGIYTNYQNLIGRNGALDFNDLIGQAVDLVTGRPDVAESFRARWPVVLEDEAQDSVPLQEMLLGALTGDAGNWVRVGDPNQAITSSFTAAHPRFLRDFMERPDVVARPLPHSGRCAPKILEAANRLLNWTCDSHPVPEVRTDAFLRQDMRPTDPGDAQQNPPDSEADIRIRVFGHREDEEIPQIAKWAFAYTQKRPEQTVAVLVPTNDVGYKVAEQLDLLGTSYDNLLRGGTREKEIAGVLHAHLALLADPLRGMNIRTLFQKLAEFGHPAAAVEDERREHLAILLGSVFQAEKLLYPAANSDDLLEALPGGRTKPGDMEIVGRFIRHTQKIFEYRLLPIDDLIIAIADELFTVSGHETSELDLAIAYQIANTMRSWHDLDPQWRLPELATELNEIAEGRRRMSVVMSDEGGFEPKPGRITLTTQHGAKGLEWDGVFLMGVDGGWIPSDLNSYFRGVDAVLGGDPTAEMTTALHDLMTDHRSSYPGRTATESAHIELIGERLRLLYVGITRAKRFLHISRSRKTRAYTKEYDSEPTTAMGVLYRYLKEIE